jgi:hypothetical protein
MDLLLPSRPDTPPSSENRSYATVPSARTLPVIQATNPPAIRFRSSFSGPG